MTCASARVNGDGRPLGGLSLPASTVATVGMPASLVTSVATSDVSGDGQLDLIAAQQGGNTYVFVGPLSGALTSADTAATLTGPGGERRSERMSRAATSTAMTTADVVIPAAGDRRSAIVHLAPLVAAQPGGMYPCVH